MRTPTATESRLLALVASELDLPPPSIGLETPIRELGDSLDWLELLMTVEETFGVDLDEARTGRATTLADLARLLPEASQDALQASLQEAVKSVLPGLRHPHPL